MRSVAIVTCSSMGEVIQCWWLSNTCASSANTRSQHRLKTRSSRKSVKSSSTSECRPSWVICRAPRSNRKPQICSLLPEHLSLPRSLVVPEHLSLPGRVPESQCQLLADELPRLRSPLRCPTATTLEKKTLLSGHGCEVRCMQQRMLRLHLRLRQAPTHQHRTSRQMGRSKIPNCHGGTRHWRTAQTCWWPTMTGSSTVSMHWRRQQRTRRPRLHPHSVPALIARGS
mmetsp:Transcript_70942/g.130766  ORF Transcript_70942/g.130766 Transcript_70942/m.130766 type:complete len:227 (-) Transcript_70942:40-720(-)